MEEMERKTYLDTEFVRYAMEYKGITTKALAVKMGVNVTRLREYLNGKPVRKLDFYYRIADALGVKFPAVIRKEYFYLVPKGKKRG